MSVSELLPAQVSKVERSPRSISLHDDGDVIEALGTETAREILAVLGETPKTASEIATETDVSLQSVAYHLDRLQDVELVDAVGIRYSSKGKEMTVYAAISDPIVFQFGGGTPIQSG